MKLTTKQYHLGTLIVEYLLDEESGQISFCLLPEGKESCYPSRREWLNIPEMVRLGMDKRAWEVGSLCHLSLDKYPQSKGAGETLKYGPATRKMRFQKQQVEEEGEKLSILTILSSEEGEEIHHRLTYHSGDRALEVQTSFLNRSKEPVKLELLTSVSLDNLSPFGIEDGKDRIALHRFYGGWSLEGKHREDTMEELNLERSWMCAFPESEKFGSVGSYPVHRFFPVACVEDRKEKVFWGIQLEAPSSWQMELSRDGDCCSFSAGTADVEFGNWCKTVKPGERYDSTKAYISVADNLDEVLDHLLEVHHRIVDEQPQTEQDLPIVFNDWCATYGEPCHEKTLTYGEKLKGTPVKYIVIDAGWTESPEKSFGQGGNGDWNYSKKKFPEGVLATSRELAKKGFLLGIWMEFEVTTQGAKVYEKEYDPLHLTRNGRVINTGGDRSFWDFRKEETRAYLTEKVTDFLRENEISYLKIDYNSSIGIGCDGGDSLGEGLQTQMAAVQEFLRGLRKALPELVIENCASGGHRLESSFMDLTAMSSFSDAHECKELPYIAANLQHLVLARQNQIWVVINDSLSEKEITYRLASGFLGRFCLSGKIDTLSDVQWEKVCKAMDYYHSVTDVIKYGTVRVLREESKNMHHPEGVQIVERRYQNRTLLVIHCFTEEDVFYYRGTEGMKEIFQMGREGISAEVEGKELRIQNLESGDGMVVLLETVEKAE